MMTDLEAEAVVIGAGPTGAAAAWRLASRGVRTIVFDRGGWPDHAAVGRDRPDWEIRRATALHSNPNVRRAAEDYPVDDAESPIRPMVANGIGGTSTHWSAHVPRFRPEDFRIRTLDGVGDDWPIAYADLDPWYTLNEDRMGTAALTGDPASPPHGGGAMTLPTLGAAGRRFAAVFDRLGWHWWPVDLVVGRGARDPGAPQCTHIGPCDIGCVSRRRAGADVAYMRDAVAAGARVLTHARVERLEHDASGRVTAAVCRTDAGTLRVRGDRFVLAANGMGTPRLLLLSASGRFPDGLANRSGLVGRNLMLHPYARVDGLFEERMGAWVSGEKAGIISFQFYATDPGRGFVRGLKLQLVGGPPPVALSLGAVTGERLAWGAGHHAAFERRFDRTAGFTVCAEDLADPENRILLSDRLADADGLPAPKWIYRLSENSRRALDFGMDRAAEVLTAAGAGAIFRTPLRAEAGFHIMGTARMGDDPETSVADPWGRCHDVPNLWIADASLFVTAAAINPTATAQALALRAADRMIAMG